ARSVRCSQTRPSLRLAHTAARRTRVSVSQALIFNRTSDFLTASGNQHFPNSILSPLRKRSPCRNSKNLDQLANQFATFNQLRHQRLKFIPLPVVPLRRDPSSDFPNDLLVHLFYERKPRLKRFPSQNFFIHFISRINAAQRVVRKRPLP